MSGKNEKLLTTILTVALALIITLVGVVWGVTNGRVSDHEKRIKELEIDQATIRQSLITTEKNIEEIKTDLKEILRRTK